MSRATSVSIWSGSMATICDLCLYTSAGGPWRASCQRYFRDALRAPAGACEFFELMCAHLAGIVAKRLTDRSDPRIRWCKTKNPTARSKQGEAACSMRPCNVMEARQRVYAAAICALESYLLGSPGAYRPSGQAQLLLELRASATSCRSSPGAFRRATDTRFSPRWGFDCCHTVNGAREGLIMPTTP